MAVYTFGRMEKMGFKRMNRLAIWFLVTMVWSLLPAAAMAAVSGRGTLGCSVVNLTTSRGISGGVDTVLPPAGSCSGILIDDEGHLVTTLSCLLNRFEVVVSLCDASSWPARFVGSDRESDVAVLQIRAPRKVLSKFHPAILGTLEDVEAPLEVRVVAMPRPGWLVVSSGSIAARPRAARFAQRVVEDLIYTTVPWSPLLEGGAVADDSGRVVGLVVDPGKGLRSTLGGFGLAISGELIQSVATRIITRGPLPKPWIGADFMDITPTLATLFDLPVKRGVMVVRLAPKGPAAKARLAASNRSVTVGGVKYPIGGDIIVAADGRKVRKLADLMEILRGKAPGDRLTLELLRGEKRRKVTLVLGKAPLKR